MTRLATDEITLHGNRVTYRTGGEGPLLVLIHGITSSSASWETVLPLLAERYTIVAPDLLGHGQSDKPAGDYSLGSHACLVRDLMLALGHRSGTIAGHSLGGGIAMQLAYQYPERCGRLVLMSSGGIARDVHLLLRAAAVPGSELWVAATSRAASRVGAALGRGLATIGLRASPDVAEIARGYASLADPDRRAAFLATVRSVISSRGQRVDASDRLYLAAGIPVLIIWGARDPIIPVHHAERAHEAIAGSRLEIFAEVGHLPQLETPGRFVAVIERFLDETQPAPFDAEEWRARLGRTAEMPQRSDRKRRAAP